MLIFVPSATYDAWSRLRSISAPSQNDPLMMVRSQFPHIMEIVHSQVRPIRNLDEVVQILDEHSDSLIQLDNERFGGSGMSDLTNNWIHRIKSKIMPQLKDDAQADHGHFDQFVSHLLWFVQVRAIPNESGKSSDVRLTLRISFR